MRPKAIASAAGTLVLCFLLHAEALVAQQVPVMPGSRVRVSAASLVAPLVANFLEQRGDTLVFIEESTGPGVWSITLPLITKLETTGGDATGNRPYVLKGAAIGAGSGLVVGLLFAAAARPADEGRTYNRPVTGLIGAAIGGGIGAFLGSRRQTERWIDVPLPGRLSLLPDPRGGLLLTLRVR